MRLGKIWSGRRGSNPRPRPWQGRALPLSYTRIRDGGDWPPTTAHLCQMRSVNATLLRTVKIRTLSGDLSRNGRQIRRNQAPGRFRTIENDGGRLQLGQIDPALNRTWPC